MPNENFQRKKKLHRKWVYVCVCLCVCVCVFVHEFHTNTHITTTTFAPSCSIIIIIIIIMIMFYLCLLLTTPRKYHTIRIFQLDAHVKNIIFTIWSVRVCVHLYVYQIDMCTCIPVLISRDILVNEWNSYSMEEKKIIK